MSEFRRSLQSILSSKSSWTTTHRQRLMYGVNLNVLAERRAALHFKATRLQARAVDATTRRIIKSNLIYSSTSCWSNRPRTRMRAATLSFQDLLRGRTIGVLCAEWHILTFDYYGATCSKSRALRSRALHLTICGVRNYLQWHAPCVEFCQFPALS